MKSFLCICLLTSVSLGAIVNPPVIPETASVDQGRKADIAYNMVLGLGMSQASNVLVVSGAGRAEVDGVYVWSNSVPAITNYATNAYVCGGYQIRKYVPASSYSWRLIPATGAVHTAAYVNSNVDILGPWESINGTTGPLPVPSVTYGYRLLDEPVAAIPSHTHGPSTILRDPTSLVDSNGRLAVHPWYETTILQAFVSRTMDNATAVGGFQDGPSYLFDDQNGLLTDRSSGYYWKNPWYGNQAAGGGSYGVAIPTLSDAVTVANCLAPSPSAITVSGWMKPVSGYGILWQRDTYGKGMFLDVTAGQPKFYLGEAGYAVQSGDTVPDGAWVHVCGIFDNGTMRIYVDGIEKDSYATGVPTLTPYEATSFLGNSQWYNERSDAIDEVRVYSTALSSNEVFQLATTNRYGIGLTNGLVALYHFDEGAGVTATDSSGNGNGGTLTGGASWTNGITQAGIPSVQGFPSQFLYSNMTYYLDWEGYQDDDPEANRAAQIPSGWYYCMWYTPDRLHFIQLYLEGPGNQYGWSTSGRTNSSDYINVWQEGWAGVGQYYTWSDMTHLPPGLSIYVGTSSLVLMTLAITNYYLSFPASNAVISTCFSCTNRPETLTTNNLRMGVIDLQAGVTNWATSINAPYATAEISNYVATASVLGFSARTNVTAICEYNSNVVWTVKWMGARFAR